MTDKLAASVPSAIEPFPVPYFVYNGRQFDSVFRNGRTVCTMVNGVEIAIAYCDFHTTERARANAAFIVRAVNAHDELVGLLRRALEYVEDSVDDLGHPFVHEIRAALAKVEPGVGR